VMTVLWDKSTVRARFRRSSPLNATVPTKIPAAGVASHPRVWLVSCLER
jgi:hypothetical protein